MDANKIINTGIKFFGLKVLLESSGSPEIDKAAKSTFKDSYWLASADASRVDVRKMLAWSQITKPVKEQKAGQGALFRT